MRNRRRARPPGSEASQHSSVISGLAILAILTLIITCDSCYDFCPIWMCFLYSEKIVFIARKFKGYEKMEIIPLRMGFYVGLQAQIWK